MCGRFTRKTPVEDLAAHFHPAEIPHLPPRYNIAPTQPVATVLVLTGDRQFRLMRWGQTVVCLAWLSLAAGAVAGADDHTPATPAPASPASASRPAYQWKNGLPADPRFFPLAVWLQDPKNAPKFKALGINTYVGLWKGPSEQQLSELARQGMKAICSQNDVALKHLDDPTIIGWMHDDEPDNAQDIGRWKSADAIREAWPEAPARTLKEWGRYGPPIPPKTVVADYQCVRQKDPSRPVLLNLGQGVAFDRYVGRGYRSGKLEDYPKYIEGCDIVSFDIYPVVHDAKEVAGKLEYVGRGVERLVKWSAGRSVWNCIECTHIGNPTAIASPEQIRAEVWLSIIHGSRGIIYFVHEFKPKFIEAGLLAHPEQAKAVEQVNKQVLALAEVINSAQPVPTIKAKPSDADGQIAFMARQHKGTLYIFAAQMRNKPASVTFDVPQAVGRVEIIDEDRTIGVKDSQFIDTFGPYGVHLYKLPPSR